MTSSTEKLVLDYLNKEVRDGISSPLTPQSDLARDVRWDRLHEDDQIEAVIWGFCHRFKIESERWPRYLQVGVLDHLIPVHLRGGPSVDFFNYVRLETVIVRDLVLTAKEKIWNFKKFPMV